MRGRLIHIPQSPGARSARSCAPRAWTRDAVAPSGPGGPVPPISDTPSVAGSLRDRKMVKEALPRDPATRKLRALWISAFHLGLTRERSDEALAAWLGRQRSPDAAQATPAALARAVPALEAWLARAAGVDWRPHLSLGRNGRVRETRHPRARVLEAQWRLLHRAGLVRIGSLAALGAYAARHAGLGRLDSHLALNEPQADALIRHLGKRLRAARGTHEEGRASTSDASHAAREKRLNRRRARAAALRDVFPSTDE